MPKPVPAFEPSEVLHEFGMVLAHDKKPGYIIQTPEEQTDALFYSRYGEVTNIMLGNAALTVHAHRETIIETVRENPVTIIVAETGAGKSTQVPQYLVEAGYSKVYITQPRRPAARNVFMRIRDEISEIRGKFAGEDLVSYQTAGERDGPDDAAVRVVTDGLQLVKELHNKGATENEVLIIDEAHEWNSNVEVLVAWTKKEIAENPNLRVVVMSATMDAQHLAEYYSDVCPSMPPIIDVPGRTYKVEKTEDSSSTVVNEVLRIAMSLPGEEGELPEGPNGILVFQPGKREIYSAIDEIRNRIPKELLKIAKIFPLHAKLSPTEQQAALTHYPGSIKIVIATNVAQTSLTIPDIKYVVDSGYQRQREIDSEGVPGLVMRPVSRADGDQRAGRTGRVGDGHYVLTKLNATTPYVSPEERDEYPVPEMMRSDVTRHALRLKALGLDIAEFDMYHPASKQTIELAKRHLSILGALDVEENITPLGLEMNEYPVCASSARFMVESARYRESTRAYLAAIAAAKEVGGLQYFAHNVGKRWLQLTEEDSSDLLVQLDIFLATQSMNSQDIVDYDLDVNNVERAHEQFQKIAKLADAKIGILRPPSPEEREDIRNCITVGYLPSIYVQDGDHYINALNPHFKRRELSNRSLVQGSPSFVIGDPYNVELRDGEEVITRHCIENVTKVTAQVLGAAALNHVIWQPEGFQLRGGKYKQRERQYLFGIDLGVVQEVPATPSPQLRAEIIDFSLHNPGAAQQELRAIKKEVERLAHLAKDHIPKLTHHKIIELVNEAASDDITTPAEIEDNLRAMLLDPERGLSVDQFVDPQRRQEIIKNAPPTIQIEGETYKVDYRNRRPIIKRYNRENILRLDDEPILLEDGREVMFAYKNSEGRTRICRLFELKQRIEDNFL